MREKIFLVFLLVWAVGCVRATDSRQKPVESSPAYVEMPKAERSALNLPLPNVLTLAKNEDIKNAKKVSKAVRNVVGEYIKKEHRGVEWEISAAREVKGHILLWLNFPKILDGGVDVIYSKEKKAIVGTFLGGYRG